MTPSELRRLVDRYGYQLEEASFVACMIEAVAEQAQAGDRDVPEALELIRKMARKGVTDGLDVLHGMRAVAV